MSDQEAENKAKTSHAVRRAIAVLEQEPEWVLEHSGMRAVIEDAKLRHPEPAKSQGRQI